MVTNEREEEQRRDEDELLGILDFRKIRVLDLIWVFYNKKLMWWYSFR